MRIVLLLALFFCTTLRAQPGADVPESYLQRVQREGRVLELTVLQAVRLALAKNLEIAIESFNEDLYRQRLVTAEGFYDPVLNFTVGRQSSNSPSTSVLTAGSGVATFSSDSFAWNSSLQQNVPGGGRFTLSFDNTRNETNSTFRNFNPEFATDFNLSFVQPLWRGFLRTETDRQLKLVNLDGKISDSQFKQRVSDIVQRVTDQYWELVFAIENHETHRQSVELALLQYHNNQQRVRIGVLAPLEITSAEAEVAARQQEMMQAEVQIVRAENALKDLISPDPRDSIWNRTLIPSERPQVENLQISLDQAVQTSLARRPELEGIQLELEKNGVDQEFFKKEGKPAVSLRTSFGSVARAGTIFRNVGVDLDGDGVPDAQRRVPDPDNPAFGNFRKSINEVFDYDFKNWSVFVDVQVPLGHRASQGRLAQAKIEEARLHSHLKSRQQLIAVEVRNAYQTLAIHEKRLGAARAAHRLSEEQLRGTTRRFEEGMATNFEVLRLQRDLAETQVQELRALVDYRQALTALRKATFTIIDDNDIVLARR